VTFENANLVYLSNPEAGYDGDNSKVFVDNDGSVTGTAGRTVVVSNPFLLTDACEPETDWNAHVCEADYASLWVETLDGDPQDIKPLTLERDDGETQTLMGSEEDSTVAISSVLPDQNYEIAFNGGTLSKARFVLWRGKDRWVRLSVDYPSAPKVTKYGCDLDDPNDWCEGKAASLSELDASTSSAYYYDAGAKKLYLKIVSDGYDWEELEVKPAS
jgi:cell migration-inducing and hyaluronan-binding protein